MLRLIFISLVALFLISCAKENITPNATQKKPLTQSNVPETCLNWFDGCNNCHRVGKEKVSVCTKKACLEYQPFKCTKWKKEQSKQPKPEDELSHRDIELENLPRSPQLSNE